MRVYTEAEGSFIREYAHGHSRKEIADEFNLRFKPPATEQSIIAYMKNHKIKNGRDGRFKKGNVSHNKGKKGCCAPGSEKGWFKKGHTPANHRPVGSERISKDGYIETKVAEPNKWRLKHRLIWEEGNGHIPKDKCIILLNGDKTDTRIENLALIDRSVNVRMNQSGLRYADSNSTKAAVEIGKLMSAIGEVRRRKR